MPSAVANWNQIDLAILVIERGDVLNGRIRFVDAGKVLGTGRKIAADQDQIANLVAIVAGQVDHPAATDQLAEDVVRTDRFRPAQYFMQELERPSISALLAEAREHEERAATEAARFQMLATSLRLPDE